MTGVSPYTGESSTQTLARLQREQHARWPVPDARFGDEPTLRDRYLAFWRMPMLISLLVAGLLFLAAVTLWTCLPSARMTHASRTALADGTVTYFARTGHGEDEHCTVVASFTVDGRSYRATPGGIRDDCFYAQGAQVGVQYDPEHPADALMLQSRFPLEQLALLPFLLVPLSGLFLLYGLLTYPMRWAVPRLTLVAPDAPAPATTLVRRPVGRTPVAVTIPEPSPWPYVARPHPPTGQTAPRGFPYRR